MHPLSSCLIIFLPSSFHTTVPFGTSLSLHSTVSVLGLIFRTMTTDSKFEPLVERFNEGFDHAG
jgi:hypothetical protein